MRSNEAIITSEDKVLAFDQTEVTIGTFEKFVRLSGLVTQAERNGGGMVYANGWEQKPGWTWLTPYGQAAHPDEPAVHVTSFNGGHLHPLFLKILNHQPAVRGGQNQ